MLFHVSCQLVLVCDLGIQEALGHMCEQHLTVEAGLSIHLEVRRIVFLGELDRLLGGHSFLFTPLIISDMLVGLPKMAHNENAVILGPKLRERSDPIFELVKGLPLIEIKLEYMGLVHVIS